MAEIDSGVVDWLWDGRLQAEGYDDDDLANWARVLLKPCPHCNAKPGKVCTTAAGKEIHLDFQHVARRF